MSYNLKNSSYSNSLKSGYIQRGLSFLYYLMISGLFTSQLLLFINAPGDQVWFREQAQKINYDYLSFAFERYQTWSSRLLIESATMFFSVHHIIFDMVLFLFNFLFIYATSEYLLKKHHWTVKCLVPLLFLLVFPTSLFTGAGLIATVTNYYFPLLTFFASLYLMQQKRVVYSILALPCLLFALMQEQVTVIATLYFFYTIVFEYLEKRRVNIQNGILMGLSLVAVASAKFAPGSALRSASEIATWYPEFETLTTFRKIYLGFIETNRVLFFDTSLSHILILLILVLAVAILKRKFFSAGASLFLLTLIGSHRLGFPTIFQSVNEAIPIERGLPMFYLITLFSFFLLILAFCIWEVIEKNSTRTFAVVAVIIAYIARMLVSFSPTIYASGIRTFIPIVFSIYFVGIILIGELATCLMDKEEKNEEN